MSEPAERLASALDRLRASALRSFARRLGVDLPAAAARGLLARHGPGRAAELLGLVARLPGPLRSLLLRFLGRAADR